MAQSVEKCLLRKLGVLCSIPIARKREERRDVGKHPSLDGRPHEKD